MRKDLLQIRCDEKGVSVTVLHPSSRSCFYYLSNTISFALEGTEVRDTYRTIERIVHMEEFCLVLDTDSHHTAFRLFYLPSGESERFKLLGSFLGEVEFDEFVDIMKRNYDVLCMFVYV